ncbi:MAG TPA: Rieske (2Fe-2S) protein [Ignavibacteria bacterium]|nr:Rieske (2Fe-2S) protein [Ignavibacteria bacterium]
MIEVPEYTGKKSRRDFLNYVLSIGFFGWIGAILYPLYSYLVPPKSPDVDTSNISIGKESEMENNSSKMFKIGNKPGILIKTNEGELKALSATCTHLDCTVQFKKDENLIWCACHNGKYDLNGINISGPPPKPLTKFNVVVQKDEIYVQK